jgi:hypothetical protein
MSLYRSELHCQYAKCSRYGGENPAGTGRWQLPSNLAPAVRRALESGASS